MKTIRFKVATGPTFRRQRSSSNGVEKHHSPAPCVDLFANDRKNYRSRAGCAECKRRRVKCDETFPVCLRCQRRGDVCEAAPRLRKWQMESPWIATGQKEERPIEVDASDIEIQPKTEKSLLRYWLERASQIMVIDPDINPLSFPVLEHIERSPGLVHALQSVSAAHQHFFDPSKLSRCLEERDLAIRLVRREIAQPPEDVFPVFLTVLLLGLSTAWIEGPTTEFGLQHLRGARALIDIVLDDSSVRDKRPSVFGFMIGAYLYWDMSCAFLVPSCQQLPEYTAEILMAVLDVGTQYHPIGGYCTEIFYFIGLVGRYCRYVHDTGVRDHDLEDQLEHNLLSWEPTCEDKALAAMSEAFRLHGLINLAAICKRSPCQVNVLAELFGSNTADPMTPSMFLVDTPSLESIDAWFENDPIFANGQFDQLPESNQQYLGDENETDDQNNQRDELSISEIDEEPLIEKEIRERAVKIVRSLTAIPTTHACTNLQAIPLLTAGSELTSAESEERALVYQRFRAMYSLNHIRSNLIALKLIQEVWELRDAGITTTWLSLMIEKGWSVMLG